MHNPKEGGYIVTLVTFFSLLLLLSIALSLSVIILYGQKISYNSVKSTESYYAAEAGIEDALLRLKKNPLMSVLSYNIRINNAVAEVDIPAVVAGSRAVTAKGDSAKMIRGLRVIYSINSQEVSFHYGVQVGEGGLVMGNGSKVIGNVFSNGNISGSSGTITNDVVVAGNGRSIDDVTVDGDALSYSCLSPAIIKGDLTYVSGGTKTCAVNGSTAIQTAEISAQSMPISQEQIDEWKDAATSGGIISGNLSITNNQTRTLGPIKITGDLTISNNSTLNITGTIYVVGKITFDNNSIVKLDNSYGSLSGIILSDGAIESKNNAVLRGSGQAGSYLLALSTKSGNSVVIIDNNATGAIFYTSSGEILVKNNVRVKEATGYKVRLDNNAIVEYESGLADMLFSSGPSGGWEVVSWSEQ